MSASVSRSAAEASTSSGRRKLRLLGLHGWRTSAAVLHGQLTRSGWHQQLGDLVEITFVDAPHAARGPSSPDVTLAFGNQPFYEWWDARQAENGDWRFHGWSESKAFVEKFLREHGPFDGFLGFSQGGILASALLAMAQQGTVRRGSVGCWDLSMTRKSTCMCSSCHPQAMEGIPPMKVAIVIGSMASRAAEHQSAFKLPVTVPSIHVYGEKDPLKRCACRTVQR